jgi:hypothetical protein
MAERMPVGELDPRFSSDGVTATPWTTARRRLRTAQSYWLATVRPNARPHVTTIAAVWLDGALHFTTGRRERKAKNLARNSHCTITAGCHVFRGLDVVVEGTATRVTGAATLRELAKDCWEARRSVSEATAALTELSALAEAEGLRRAESKREDPGSQRC